MVCAKCLVEWARGLSSLVIAAIFQEKSAASVIASVLCWASH